MTLLTYKANQWIGATTQYDHEDLYQFRDGGKKYKYGYDWVDDDEDPSPGDREHHGTHCAGIATAVMDNSKGIAGIAPNCTYIAERTMEFFGGWEWPISRGIMDAAEHKADIISMSLGMNVSSELMRDATLYASSSGCILVAAAGNDGKKKWYRGGIVYPAVYPWVIAVGSIDQNNSLAPSSDWGKDLDLVAPGVGILSTVPQNNYTNMNGTSQAAPHVAGVAALVKSRAERWPREPLATNPLYHLNNEQIIQVLLQSAIDLGPLGWDERYGYGKVDASRAIRCVNISGNVLESLLNAPIPGVEVKATSIEGPPGIYSTRENSSLARIASNGDYFIRVPPGIYQLCAMAYGYIPSHGSGGDRLELPAFDLNGHLYNDNRDFRLVPFPCNVTGRVNDDQTGQPIVDAAVLLDGPPHIYPPHPKVKMNTRTNSSGYYHFILEYSVHPPYPSGDAMYNITLNEPEYRALTRNFTLNWSKVMTNYYKCRLDPMDFNPFRVNFSLNVAPA